MFRNVLGLKTQALMLSRWPNALMLKQASRFGELARSFHVKSCNHLKTFLSESARGFSSGASSSLFDSALWKTPSIHLRRVGNQCSNPVYMWRVGTLAKQSNFEGLFPALRRSLHSSKGSGRRFFSGQGRPSRSEHIRMVNEARRKQQRAKNLQIAMYMGGMTLFTISFTYASVPLYRIFCQKTGFAGTVKTENVEYGERAKPVSGKRLLTIKFNADVSETMPWRFVPQQHQIKVVPGEAALVFYKALNKTAQPIIGVASYNVQPEGAAAYFNKIQCFCFEEQMLGPNEKIDMPVFFFIDPDFLNDKAMDSVETITLSYTFFKSGDANAPDIAGMLEPAHPPVYPRPQSVSA